MHCAPGGDENRNEAHRQKEQRHANKCDGIARATSPNIMLERTPETAPLRTTPTGPQVRTGRDPTFGFDENGSGSIRNHRLRFDMLGESIENGQPSLALLLFRMSLLCIEGFADSDFVGADQELYKQSSAAE